MATITTKIGTNQSTVVRGNVALISGKWSASTTEPSLISTGGSAVLAAGATNGTTTTIPVLVYNTASGVITLKPIRGTADFGRFWAIVELPSP